LEIVSDGFLKELEIAGFLKELEIVSDGKECGEVNIVKLADGFVFFVSIRRPVVLIQTGQPLHACLEAIHCL